MSKNLVAVGDNDLDAEEHAIVIGAEIAIDADDFECLMRVATSLADKEHDVTISLANCSSRIVRTVEEMVATLPWPDDFAGMTQEQAYALDQFAYGLDVGQSMIGESSMARVTEKFQVHFPENARRIKERAERTLNGPIRRRGASLVSSFRSRRRERLQFALNALCHLIIGGASSAAFETTEGACLEYLIDQA